MEDYYGPADNAKMKCQEGCDECVGTGEHECVMCSDNYEMTPGCPGTCRWCDPEACDANGMPLCGNRGIANTYQSSCDCVNGQYFDGMFCRNCGDGCEVCDSQGNNSEDVAYGFMCSKCEDGLFTWGNLASCWDWTPFNYQFIDPEYAAYPNEAIFDIEINFPEDEC